MARETYALKTINDRCQDGDIVKLVFKKGGFFVGVYSGGSGNDALLSNVYEEKENRYLNYHLLGLTAIRHVDPEQRSVIFALNRGRISGYQILGRSG